MSRLEVLTPCPWAKGRAITTAFLKYEKRQAEAMGMAFTPFKPLVIKEKMIESWRRMDCALGDWESFNLHNRIKSSSACTRMRIVRLSRLFPIY
jgi:hypothetical protein